MSDSLTVFVTGASGFIGRRLVAELAGRNGIKVVAGVRAYSTHFNSEITQQVVELHPAFDWSKVLDGVNVVIHLAAIAHVRDSSVEFEKELQQTNLNGTVRLANQALDQGVSKFVFLSSIGVLGSLTEREPFSEQAPLNPQTSYSESKAAAEKALKQIVQSTRMSLTIVRPPLVYGRGAPGNFGFLVKLIETRIPLPFGSISNQRSLISRTNLVKFLMLCATEPSTNNEAYVVSDGDFSTPELCREIASGLGIRSFILPFPKQLLIFLCSMLGKKSQILQVTSSLKVDASKARKVPGWYTAGSIRGELGKS